MTERRLLPVPEPDEPRVIPAHWTYCKYGEDDYVDLAIPYLREIATMLMNANRLRATEDCISDADFIIRSVHRAGLELVDVNGPHTCEGMNPDPRPDLS